MKAKPDSKAVLTKIKVLFAKAEQNKSDIELASSFVQKARRAAQRARTPLPSNLKKRFCRFCGTYWIQSKTVRVRLQKQKVVYYCLKCKSYTRHPYVREKKHRTLDKQP